MDASEDNFVSALLHPPRSSPPEYWQNGWSAPLVPAPRTAPRHALSATVGQELIPRLLLAHQCPVPSVDESRTSEELLEEAAIELARLACAVDGAGARSLAERLLDQGVSLETFWLSVVHGAAQLIGYSWEEDRLDFFQVTAGVGCLQGLLRETADAHSGEVACPSSCRRILLVPVPGEAHSFGAAMAAELFRRRSWEVDAECAPSLDELLARIRETHFQVVGLSISSDHQLPQLAEAVRKIRIHSCNRRVGVMVGGPPIAKHPEWHSRVGADACSQDALHGIALAEQLLGLLVQQA